MQFLDFAKSAFANAEPDTPKRASSKSRIFFIGFSNQLFGIPILAPFFHQTNRPSLFLALNLGQTWLTILLINPMISQRLCGT